MNSRPQQRRRKWLKLSFLLLVVLPIFGGVLFFSFVATDRYVSGAGFAVRRMGGDNSIDALGSLTGLANTGTTTSDSYIILNYLKSRDLVKQLNDTIDLAARFNHQGIDAIFRLDTEASIEDIVKYWNRRIKTSFDNTSGIIMFEVEAFTPEDSQLIATTVLNYADVLINNLSEKARKDTLRFSEMEVERSEKRLQQSLEQLRVFREQEKAINPVQMAQLQMDVLVALEKDLSLLKARISTLERANIDKNTPSIKSLYRQAQALEQQIMEINKDSSGRNAHLSDLLATYESLEIERNFAQQAYASSLISLEKARMEADRQQRYLAVYSVPARAEDAMYPRRIVDSLLFAIAILITWGIGVLVTYSVRDHLS